VEELGRLGKSARNMLIAQAGVEYPQSATTLLTAAAADW
jgi:hypothetical protein